MSTNGFGRGGQSPTCIGYLNPKLGGTPYLSELLGSDIRLIRGTPNPKGISHIAGWGHKPTARKARALAEKLGVGYVRFEDGFIRSVGLGSEGAPLHSMIIDYSGIYYDATDSSDLEKLLSSKTLSTKQTLHARQCMEIMQEHKITKYNTESSKALRRGSNQPAVLVVDQTRGDMSISLGLANAHSFKKMLNDAISENPDCDILVKSHPETIAKTKKGYLGGVAKDKGCTLITNDVNPWDLFPTVKKVYVVTSQLGFEALIAGKTVHCYGMPFYAGWGLTQDQLRCERRTRSVNLDTLFHCAYLEYCRYINPLTGERCRIEDAIKSISDFKFSRSIDGGKWSVLLREHVID